MGLQIIGTCGLCGGRVTVPDVWMGIYPPVPTCESCGAVAQQPQLPVIPMQPNPYRFRHTTTGSTHPDMVHPSRTSGEITGPTNWTARMLHDPKLTATSTPGIF